MTSRMRGIRTSGSVGARGLIPRATRPEGRSLTDLWAYSDHEMEAIHDFIQWMFPLREPSRFNPDTPLLTDADVAAFAAEPALRAAMARSVDRFLAFVGLEVEETEVVPAADFTRKQTVWTAPNHNWLRITRVITSARLLGQDATAQAFFRFLDAGRAAGTVRADATTFRYWSNAAHG